MELSDLYKRNLTLFNEVLNSNITKHKTFLHVKSNYKDIWYNFIVPLGTPDEFDFGDALKTVENEKLEDTEVSYYIPKDLEDEYKEILQAAKKEELATEAYMHLKMDKPFDDINEYDIKELAEEHLDETLKLSQECFPEWENNKEYSTRMYNLVQNNPFATKIIKNFVGLDNNVPVSFGGVIVDTKAKLAYLHNAGTAENYRKKGYYSALIKHRCNFAYENGVNEIYAIVEENGLAYKSMQKLGFVEKDKFIIFA